MSSVDIENLISAEIAGTDETSHGWKFRPYLVSPPELVTLQAGNATCEVWMVLREPSGGYLVIFDPEEGEFGLATGGVIISYHASFLATLEAL